MRCELITWEYFYELARQLSLAMHAASFQPDLIVAISRGGCIPARVICDYLDVFDLDVIKIEHYHGVHKQKSALLKYPLSAKISTKRVLLIDDVSDTGDSFEVGIKHLLEHGQPAELKTAALHHKTVSSYTPDFYSEIVHEWRWIIYPWALMEDLRSLLHEMAAPPATAAEFARYIKQQHGMEVPGQYLEDVLSLADCEGETPLQDHP
jgi:hypoxanthine phosphoribosyltransferase